MQWIFTSTTLGLPPLPHISSPSIPASTLPRPLPLLWVRQTRFLRPRHRSFDAWHVETSREAFTTVDSSSRNSHMKKFQFFSIWLSRHPHFSGGKRIGRKHVYMLQPISSHSNFPPSVFSPAFFVAHHSSTSATNSLFNPPSYSLWFIGFIV